MVTPTYNQADFLQYTIDSILAQDYSAIEYVVVDDGSTDRTSEILARNRGRVQSITQTNRGQATTLNEQWTRLETDYLSYLSSDDLLAPQAISRAVAVLDADPSVVCVFPDSHVIDENGQVIKRSVGRPFDLEDTVVTQTCHIGPGAVFRRSAFLSAGGWRTDIRLAPDWEFWLRLSRIGRIEFLREPLAFYRLHTGSYSVAETSTERSLEYVRILRDYFDGDPPEAIARRCEEAFANAYATVARNAFRRGAVREGLHYLRVARRHDPRVMRPARLARMARHVVSKPIRILLAKLNFRKAR